METTTPKAWIGCLAAYNAGHLHGRWTDLDCAESLAAECQTILNTSPGDNPEELMVFDHQGLPLSGECSPSEALAAALIVEECSEYDLALVVHAMGHLPPDPDPGEVKEWIEDRYQGEYGSGAIWAEEFARDGCMEIPEWLDNYIDWERYARDCEMSGDLYFLSLGPGTVAVLWNH